jgi:hypothetical protein
MKHGSNIWKRYIEQNLYIARKKQTKLVLFLFITLLKHSQNIIEN